MTAVGTSGAPDAGRRGRLRVLLGAAPGVGKTVALLAEGRRRRDRGDDVVVGVVDAHDRPATAAGLEGLETLAPRGTDAEGCPVLDLAAVLARRPDAVLVDDLARPNPPGSRHATRADDVDALLRAGIDVVTALDVDEIASQRDVAERVTGVRRAGTVPDELLRSADDVVLVDVPPSELRARLARGGLFPAEAVDAALGNYYREGNLMALRELALRWLADRADDALGAYRRRHGIEEAWDTRERVLVAVTGAPGTDHLVRRAARLAQRSGGTLVGVHVQRDATPEADAGPLAAHRRLLASFGGELRTVVATDVAAGLLDVARAEDATQLVLGASRRSRWERLARGAVIDRVVRDAGPVDVHVISDDGQAPRPLPVGRARLLAVSPARRAWGWGVAAVGLPLLTLALANLREQVHLPSVLLLYLLLSLTVALVGGTVPALVTAVAGVLLADWYFTEPLYGLTVSQSEEVIALVVFLLSAGIVCVLVDRVARLGLETARNRAEAEAMATLAGSLAEADALPGLVEHLQATFGMRGGALLRREGDGWVPDVTTGEAPATPEEADVVREVAPGLVLALAGRELGATDLRVLGALAGQLSSAVEARRLAVEAERAGELAQAHDLSTALLRSVSHDLRTPLAGIKASVSSLRQDDVAWSPADVDEFLRTIEEETDRLTALVANLLDLGRLRAGVLKPDLAAVGLDEVVPAALAGLGDRGQAVDLAVEERLPAVRADRALLERVVNNLVDNALKAAPTGVRVEAGRVPAGIDLRVVDHGPGIPVADRERIFEPFERRRAGDGVGLGLAIARGLVEAMDGELVLDDTPGGGTTAVVRLPVAAQEGAR